MGQLVGKFVKPVSSVAQILGRRRKRKHSTDSNDSGSEESGSETQSPKRKRLLTTTQYIYQALFKEEISSDIAIMAMGKVWNLHKVYLSQSPYFYSMFNGSWKESCQKFVHIKILDDRITLKALDAVFGSMYSDEIEIDSKDVISILATATLFHLDGIIDKCSEVMLESINIDNAINYYEAACQYGCQNVRKTAFVYLETNLLSAYNLYPNLLRQISIELMTALVSSPDLYVVETEYSVYALLRTWIFLCLNPQYDPENPIHKIIYKYLFKAEINNSGLNSNLTSTAVSASESASASSSSSSSSNISSNLIENIQKYFMYRNGKRSFLSTCEGQKYIKPFQALRTQYLTNHHMDLKIVLSDNIIPKEWLHQHVFSNWKSVLRIDHKQEEGPNNLDPDVFLANCMRFGRTLSEPGYQKWRFTGFYFGLDLVLIANSRMFSIRRHHRNDNSERLLSLQSKKNFMIRVAFTSINKDKQPIYSQKTDITSLSLEKNEEITLSRIGPELTFPLLISVYIMFVSPSLHSFKQNLVCDEIANASESISEIGGNCGRSITPTDNIDDSAICLEPPPPSSPNALPISPNVTRRSVSATSTVSTNSSAASASSFSSTDD